MAEANQMEEELEALRKEIAVLKKPDSPKSIWERSTTAFALGIGIAAIVGAFAAYSFARTEIDKRVNERVDATLPGKLRSDPELTILSGQRADIRDAQIELTQFRSDVRADRRIFEDAVGEARAAKDSGLQAAAALQARIRDLDQSVDASKVLARIDERADAALDNLDDKLIQQLQLPTDAVIAFARARPSGAQANSEGDDPCPEGWSRYRDADGRMIVGVSDQDAPFKKGGEREHTLSVGELPRHGHRMGIYDLFINPVSGEYGAAYPLEHPAGRKIPVHSNVFESESVGNNEAHENMPPYIALYFCKKEAG